MVEAGETLAWLLEAEEGVFFGVKTNNQAEYMALIKALEKAIEYGADKIHVQSDSQLMISQLTGEFRVKNKKLKPLYGIVKKLEGKFDNVEYDHSPRDNPDIKQADKLVNQTLNREEKRQFKKKKY